MKCPGCDRVADIEENVVTAFTEVGGNDNNRFTVTLNRAYNVHKVNYTSENLTNRVIL